MSTSQNLDLLFFGRIYYDLFSRSLSSFVSLFYMQFCCPLYRLSLTWNYGWLTFLESDICRCNLKRVVGNSLLRNWQQIFPLNDSFVLWMKPFQDWSEYPDRSISGKIWNNNDQSSRQRVKQSTKLFEKNPLFSIKQPHMSISCQIRWKSW